MCPSFYMAIAECLSSGLLESWAGNSVGWRLFIESPQPRSLLEVYELDHTELGLRVVQFAPGNYGGIFGELGRSWSNCVEGTMLSVKTFIVGLIMLRSSTVPALIPATLGLPLLVPNSCAPHFMQNCFVIVFPLSALWLKCVTSPSNWSWSSGTNKMVPNTDPVALLQFSQWQFAIISGSAFDL